MAWNFTICSSASSLLKLSNMNRVDQVLGMASPPQVSPTIRDHYSGEGPGSGGGSPKRPFYSAFDQQDEVVEDDIIMGGMDCLGGQSEKKRRLTMEQVRYLESSFETENKLEPERKVQIARHLGLQPRQVAVWFQNRRARSKSKQLERDYNALKADYNAVLKENEKLQAEVVWLTAQLKEGGYPEIDHAQEKKKPSASNISSSNCASVGVKIELEVTTTAQHVNGLLGDGGDELSSPTIIDNDNPTSVLPLPAAAAAAAAVMAAAKVAESANEAAAILSTTAEDLQLFTNYMQQAQHMTAAATLAQQLAVKLEGEDYLFFAQCPDSLQPLHDNNLFIAHWDAHWDDPWERLN